jgi:hypothetical protein
MALSEEHKAKLAEGRQRYKERKEAERQARRAAWRAEHGTEMEERRQVTRVARRFAKTATDVAPPPETPLVETEAFKEAVAAAAQAAIAPLLEQFKAAAGAQSGDTAALPVGVGAPDMALFRGLALAMSEIADQGTDRKRVAPEILEQRRAAGEKLKEVLAEVRANGDQPLYQLKNKIQVKLRNKGEAIIEPLWLGNDKIHYPTEIMSPDVPNLAMVPINEPAKRIYALFLESIGSGAELELKEPDGIALTPGGVVVRGNAAQQVARHLGSDWIGHDRPEGEFAEVRRNQPSQTKDVRVLGTIAPPARQNA